MAAKPLGPADLRALIRTHPDLLAFLLDHYGHFHYSDFDAVVAATARLLVECAEVFRQIVALGTDLTVETIDTMSWAEVVKEGCAVIDATRESWRDAWPNRFLHRIFCQELRQYSKVACSGVRQW